MLVKMLVFFRASLIEMEANYTLSGGQVVDPITPTSGRKRSLTTCPLFAAVVAGELLGCPDDSSTVAVLQVEPALPLEVNANEQGGGDPPPVQSEPRRGHGRGRKAKGRRPGATAASNNGKGKESAGGQDQ